MLKGSSFEVLINTDISKRQFCNKGEKWREEAPVHMLVAEEKL